MKQILALILIYFIFRNTSFAQIANNSEFKSKYKVGLKLIGENSGYYSLTPNNFFVFNGGIQVARKFKNTNHSLESGVYYISNIIGGTNEKIIYQTICLPLDYRFDKRTLYFSVGPSINYIFPPKSSFNFEKDNITLGYNLNIGFEKKLNKNFCIFIEARYAKTFYPDLRRITYGFTNYGLGIGINYKIGSKTKPSNTSG